MRQHDGDDKRKAVKRQHDGDEPMPGGSGAASSGGGSSVGGGRDSCGGASGSGSSGDGVAGDVAEAAGAGEASKSKTKKTVAFTYSAPPGSRSVTINGRVWAELWPEQSHDGYSLSCQ